MIGNADMLFFQKRTQGKSNQNDDNGNIKRNTKNLSEFKSVRASV